MENLELTEKDIECIQSRFKRDGSEASVYNATDHSLYKIFNETVRTRLKNKRNKIEMLCEMQISFFRNPIRTLSFNGQFIGYEIEWKKEDRMWKECHLKREDKIRLLQDLKEKLCFLSKEEIIYGDIKDDNLLINSKTGELSFCDVDNIQIKNMKMDLTLRELESFRNHEYLLNKDVHIYMHNIFTVSELYKKFDTYQELLSYLKEAPLTDSPFNQTGNKIVKQLCKMRNLDSRYLIDNLRKVS